MRQGTDGLKEVLGPGSVVMLQHIEEPHIIIRPTVWYQYNETSKTYERELGYITERADVLNARIITKEVVVITWPLSGASIKPFVWEGSADPHDLNEKDVRDGACERGFCGEDDIEIMRHWLTKTMGGEYMEQYQEGVINAWQRRVSRRKWDREEAQYAAACAAARTNKGAQPSEVVNPHEELKSVAESIEEEDVTTAEHHKPPSSNTGAAASSSSAAKVLEKYDRTPAKKITKKAKKAADVGEGVDG